MTASNLSNALQIFTEIYLELFTQHFYPSAKRFLFEGGSSKRRNDRWIGNNDIFTLWAKIVRFGTVIFKFNFVGFSMIKNHVRFSTRRFYNNFNIICLFSIVELHFRISTNFKQFINDYYCEFSSLKVFGNVKLQYNDECVEYNGIVGYTLWVGKTTIVTRLALRGKIIYVFYM